MWQPIEKAPKDGSEIDIWSRQRGRIADAYWSRKDLMWYEDSTNASWPIHDATHWMPKPKAPNK